MNLLSYIILIELFFCIFLITIERPCDIQRISDNSAQIHAI